MMVSMNWFSQIPIIMLLGVCSCSASAPVRQPAQHAAPDVEKNYRAAEAMAKAGDYKHAMPRLKAFVGQAPVSDLTANAYYLMAEMNLNEQHDAEALVNFKAILALPVATPLEPAATIAAAKIQLKHGDALEAEKTLDRATQWKNPSAENLIEAESLRAESLIAQKRYLPGLKAIITLSEQATAPTDRDRYKSIAQEVVEARLGEDDLREVAGSSRYSFIQPVAKFRYGVLSLEQQQFAHAHEAFTGVISLVPGTDLADRSKAYLQQLESRNHIDPHTIGVVLPLSGQQAKIGYKALRGIQLALGIFGTGRSESSKTPFKLAVVDSEGSPDGARRAIERLVEEDGAIAIIGGLLSKTAIAEGAKAQEFGVPTIMLTQKSGITQAGDSIFRNSLTSQMQIQALVETAMGKLSLHSFAILYPNDAYGIEFANLFWDEVRSHGGEITGAQPYDTKETDFRAPVQRLIGTYYLEDRLDEYRLVSKAWSEKNPKLSARKAPPAPEDLLSPVADFDAVFIPDDARAAGQIAPMLAYNNVNGTRLLGTNIWNSPSLISRGQRFVENAVFVDSYLATDPTFVNSHFFANFKDVFEEEPGLTEVQAYDSALILRQLIESGETNRVSLRNKMAHLDGAQGALGKISVNADREFRRPVEALTVKDGHIINFPASKR